MASLCGKTAFVSYGAIDVNIPCWWLLVEQFCHVFFNIQHLVLYLYGRKEEGGARMAGASNNYSSCCIHVLSCIQHVAVVVFLVEWGVSKPWH